VEMNKPMVTFLGSLAEALHPTTTLPPNPGKLYADAITKTNKLWQLFLNSICRIGQMQLLRRQIAMLLNFSAKLESNVLSCSLDVINKVLINDIQAHYKSPETKPYPDDDNPVLAELSKYLETSGFSDPITKIYVTASPLDRFPIFVFLFIISQAPRFAYDYHLGILMTRNKKSSIDSTALVVGTITFLKQFHSIYAQQIVAYLGQYLRTLTVSTPKDNKVLELPPDTGIILAFLDEICKFGLLSRKTVEGSVPAYLFDSYKRAVAP